MFFTLLLALFCVSLGSQPVATADQVGASDTPKETGATLNGEQSQRLSAALQSVYANAARAIAGQDRRTADFWLARYMGLTIRSRDAAHSDADLIPLLAQRKDLAPTAFLSGHYSSGFIDFFVQGAQALWGIPEEGVSTEDASFIIRTFSDGKHFVEVVASPTLEAWTILENTPSTAFIPLVSVERPAVIMSGTLDHGKPVQGFPHVAVNAKGNYLQYVWPIEAHDLDGDGVPEIWIRYNRAWADGFSQVLEVYKIQQDQALVLFKRFEGLAEGIARRLESGNVEVATGFATNKLTGHLGFDQHHIETFAFQDGAFVKTAERDVPHLLWGEDWRSYYFGPSNRQTVLESRQ